MLRALSRFPAGLQPANIFLRAFGSSLLPDLPTAGLRPAIFLPFLLSSKFPTTGLRPAENFLRAPKISYASLRQLVREKKNYAEAGLKKLYFFWNNYDYLQQLLIFGPRNLLRTG